MPYHDRRRFDRALVLVDAECWTQPAALPLGRPRGQGDGRALVRRLRSALRQPALDAPRVLHDPARRDPAGARR